MLHNHHYYTPKFFIIPTKIILIKQFPISPPTAFGKSAFYILFMNLPTLGISHINGIIHSLPAI